MRVALLLALLLALPIAALARPIPLEVIDLERRDFARLDDPVLMDRRALSADLDRVAAMIEALGKGAKAKAARARLAAILQDLRAAPRVRHRRYAVPDIPETPEPPTPPAEVPASGAEMTRLKNSLRRAAFRDDKMRVLREAAANLRFTTQQVIGLVGKLTFGEDQVEALVALYPRIVDPQNFHSVYRVLTHDSDRRALEARIAPLR